MSDSEAFTLVPSSWHKVYDDYEGIGSGRYADVDTSLQKALRQQYPELALTVTIAGNVPLLQFAAAGNAQSVLDIKDEAVKRLRYFLIGNSSRGIPDQLVEGRTFAKYYYSWDNESFIIYVVTIGFTTMQYILKEPGPGETTMSRNAVTDNLITSVGDWSKPDDKYIYVYDDYWFASRTLYDEVQRASWNDVILNEDMKKALTELMHKFFDSETIYKDLGVPWKRGVIFHGPAGNGKTVSIKALMNSLFQREGLSIPSLYVKSARDTWDIRMIFEQARYMAPCLLIFEDIDTIVTPNTRSYFFNEVDGLENNDGLFMVASTNHLDQLDPGLSSRPSRFDRKYLFPLPSEEERTMYCEYWRKKLKSKPSIHFPKRLSPAIAGITEGFSFAYLKEAFVATLLIIAGHRSEDSLENGGDDEGGDLDDYELWREIKKQVELLRKEMKESGEASYVPHIQHAIPDVSWKRSDERPVNPNESIYQHPHPALPIRERRGKSALIKSPRLNVIGDQLDTDFRSVPLMTDGGQFLDSRFNGP